jgi:hypothetical protein
MSVISDDMEMLHRILTALRRVFDPGPRMHAMDEQITRWFVRSWENPPRAGARLCDLCDREAATLKRGRVHLCGECLRYGARVAENPGYPSRDMVRSEALRALRAIGDDDGADSLERLAAGCPELARGQGNCAGCAFGGDLVVGVRHALCHKCFAALYKAHHQSLGE